MDNQPNLPLVLVRRTARNPKFLAKSVVFWQRLALSSLVLVSVTLASELAKAEPLREIQLAQSVVDGLPPPPSEAVRSVSSAPGFSSSIAPAPNQNEGYRSPSSQYLVYVNGDSSLLLDQVRRVASSAFLQTYDGKQVIQAGLFSEEASAQGRVQQLEAQGIGAEVATVDRDAVPVTRSQPASTADGDPTRLAAVPQVEFGQPSPYAAPSNRPANRRSYYVVIPGSANRLPNIAGLITTLGNGLAVSENAIQERSSPLGNHVRVGPFVDRGAANRWSRYFRNFGMDARVYYGR